MNKLRVFTWVLLILVSNPDRLVRASDTVPGEHEIRNIGILIFDDVDLLDVAGPYEVFSLTRLQAGIQSRFSTETAPFRVFTVAETANPVRTEGGLSINPEYTFSDVPDLDLLIVPGGPGARNLIKHEHSPVLNWIGMQANSQTELASVCTGALLLAKTGILAKRRATTHWGALDILGMLDDSIKVEKDVRYVDDGVVTSAGVSSGIYMSLYIVEKLLGKAVATDTARLMDYDYRSE